MRAIRSLFALSARFFVFSLQVFAVFARDKSSSVRNKPPLSLFFSLHIFALLPFVASSLSQLQFDHSGKTFEQMAEVQARSSLEIAALRDQLKKREEDAGDKSEQLKQRGKGSSRARTVCFFLPKKLHLSASASVSIFLSDTLCRRSSA